MNRKITKTAQPSVHFTDKYLLNPTNPVTVNLIGCGGTGSQVLTCLARMHISLLALGHTGLQVNVFDDDTVTEANKGRQLFADAEIGMNKAVAMVNRVNRFFGTNWKAVTRRYAKGKQQPAMLTLSCVDNVSARFEIADELQQQAGNQSQLYRPLYWMDFGNRQHTGQVVLSTIGTVEQPKSKKFRTVENLPTVTEEFKTFLDEAEGDDTPSCSMAEALAKQDLYINSTLAQMGASLLWRLFRDGMVTERGFFLNLKQYRSQPLPVQ